MHQSTLLRILAPSVGKYGLHRRPVRCQDAIHPGDITAALPAIGLPALLKGFIDRVFLPGFAFKYRKDSPWWDRLLAGRSARLLVSMDTPPWYYRWVYRMPGHHEMRRTILEFCGIKPVRISQFGPVKGSTEAQRAKWLETAGRAARADA